MSNYDLICQLIMMRMPLDANPIYETRALGEHPCGWGCDGIGVFCESRPGGRTHVAITVNGVEVANQSVDLEVGDHQSIVVRSLARIITNARLLIAAKGCSAGKE